MVHRARALPALLLPLVLVAAGCASLTPPQETSAAEIRALADETARIYRVARIYVLVGNDVSNIGGTYRQGMITISTPMLLSRHRDALIAHELGHYLLGHDTPLHGTTRAARQVEQQERELAANAKAVEILTRASRRSEAEALRAVYDHLHAFHRALSAGRGLVPWGHLAPCAEIGDLLARFPAQRSWTSSLECAAATATASGPVLDAHSASR